MKTFKIVCFTILATLAVSFIATNLSSQQNKIDYKFKNVAAAGTEQFRRTMENMMGPTFSSGNRITAYENGDEIFPPMLKAIRGAKKNINFESYIYWSGKIGKEFADALSERAKAGVKVNVMLDWAGSYHIEEFVKELEAAGVTVKKYHPLKWYALTRMNNRTHRKILVVDGVIGFTGGVGIADNWLGHAESEDHWRDMHYKLTGPSVGELQAAFTDNWLSESAEVLQDESYFPKIKADGPSEAQVFKSSPKEGAASSELMYLMSIYSAEKEILIGNAYFVPNENAIKALLLAKSRGVKIKIIVPGQAMNSNAVQKASRQKWGELLQAGIEIFEYEPTMYHCKYMIVDSVWTSVGSTNFDNRSFKLNSEANLNILDRSFAKLHTRIFEKDLIHSKAISYHDWQNRPWSEKALDGMSSLLDSQL